MTARILPPKTTGATAPGIAMIIVADFVAAHVVEDRLVVRRVRGCRPPRRRPASWPSGRREARPAAACPGAGWGSPPATSELTCVKAPLGSTSPWK